MLNVLRDISTGDCSRLERENRLLHLLLKAEKLMREHEAFFADQIVYADEILRSWELADPRDRWRHTGEPPPAEKPSRASPRPYSTPSSVIDAFRYVKRSKPDVSAWLDAHPHDKQFLLGLKQ